MLLCLGLDYKRGGFVDRALEAFTEVLRLDPGNEYALSNLEKLYEEQHQWTEAYATRQKLAARRDRAQRPRHHEILAFLENELGLEALKRMDYARGGAPVRAAIELDPTNAPAYLNLGDVQFYEGRTATAVATWERLVETIARARLPGVLPARCRLPEDRRERARFPSCAAG